MSDIDIRITERGFRSYRELLRWTKENLVVRTVEFYVGIPCRPYVRGPFSAPNSVKYEEVSALWKFHFGMSDDEVRKLLDLFKAIGYIELPSDGTVISFKE